MAYKKEYDFSNVSIVKGNDGRFGMIDCSNLIVAAIRYDSIQPLANDASSRYLKVEENGLIGIYDAKKVDFVQHCTLSKIVKVENGIVYGKEPFKLFGMTLFHMPVEVKLDV